MTDHPPLKDPDAAPEPARWCCSGNAEDRPLCDTAPLPYPWICPGHPDTETNRQRLQAATEATKPDQSILQALIASTLATCPDISTWDAMASSVLAAIQPHLAGHYQHAVDAAVTAEARAERAEATIDRVRAARDRIANAKASDADAIWCLDLVDAALEPPTPAHNAGPSVREAAANDRRWPLEKHGE